MFCRIYIQRRRVPAVVKEPDTSTEQTRPPSHLTHSCAPQRHIFVFHLTDMEESVLLPIEGPSTLTVTRPNLPRASSGDAAWIVVVVAGITAALHIWKLPAALPLIQEDLGLSLLTAGVLLGIVQVAGMLGGLAVSLLAENIGERVGAADVLVFRYRIHPILHG